MKGDKIEKRLEVRFIDSFRFMGSSLDELIKNLKSGNAERLAFELSQFFSSDEVPFVLRNGVYPYEYMDSFGKFEETSLPPKDQFYSTLTGKHISNMKITNTQYIFSIPSVVTWVNTTTST